MIIPKPRVLAAAALCGSLLFTALPAAAQQDDPPPPPGAFGPGGHHGPHDGGPFLRELHKLDLSDSQRQTIRGYLHDFREQGRARMDALRATHRAYETAAPGSAGYDSAVAQMADAAATAAREHVQREAALRTQIYAVLTDAQKAQLASALANLPEPPPARR